MNQNNKRFKKLPQCYTQTQRDMPITNTLMLKSPFYPRRSVFTPLRLHRLASYCLVLLGLWAGVAQGTVSGPPSTLQLMPGQTWSSDSGEASYSDEGPVDLPSYGGWLNLQMRGSGSGDLVTTSDGYTGLELGPDIVLVLEARYSSSQYVAASDLGDPSEYDDDPPEISTMLLESTETGELIDGDFECAVYYSHWGLSYPCNADIRSGYGGWVIDMTASNSRYRPNIAYNVSNELDYQFSIHVGPEAKHGRYYYGDVTWIKSGYEDEILIEGGDFFVNSPLDCTISAPPTVDFGTVNISSVPVDGLLASRQQGLTIVCQSDTSGSLAETIDISFTGLSTSPSFSDRLNVTNTTGDNMAYIRGRILEDGGSCLRDPNNDISFDGGLSHYLDDVGVGTTTVPITWSLCNNGSGLLGTGTAQATVTIDWE